MSNSKKNLKALENFKKPKISIVMQSYLENYPGSRSNPIDKFKRAVKSFQEQSYKNCELIIVADGCNKTQQTYQKHFKKDPNIKFIYIDKKSGLNMYEDRVIDGQTYKYYRGEPRKLGVAAATGDLITYMDSDDYLLPKHTLSIMFNYNQAPEGDWWINKTWFDHIKADWQESNVMYSAKDMEVHTIEPFENHEWLKIKLKKDRIILSPWLFTHRSTCTTKWQDTIKISEDVDFNKRLRSEYKNGYAYENATYVRCHYTDKWDV